MKRLGLMIPDELDEALHRVSDRTGIPISTLVRNGLIEILRQHGEEVKPKSVRRGGYRPRKDRPATMPIRPGLPLSVLRKATAAQTERQAEEPHYEPITE